MNRKRGRPKKHEPKIVFGFFSLPGSGEDVIAEYLQIRYNFTVVDVSKLIRKTYIDYQTDHQEFDLKTELGFRQQFPKDQFIKEAMKWIYKAGRPLAVILHLRTYAELKFLQDQKMYGVELSREYHERYQQQSLEGIDITKTDFTENDEFLLNYKDRDEFTFRDILEKTDYTLSYEADLGQLYKKIEKILSKIAKNDSVLLELLNQVQK